jgi:hypothetical protein
VLVQNVHQLWATFFVCLLLPFSFLRAETPGTSTPYSFSLDALVETDTSTPDEPDYEHLTEDSQDSERDVLFQGFAANFQRVDETITPEEVGISRAEWDAFINDPAALPRPDSFVVDEEVFDYTGADIVVEDLDTEGGGGEFKIPVHTANAENYRMFRGARETELATRAMIKQLENHLASEGIDKKEYVALLFVDADTISWEVEQLATILKANDFNFKVIRFKSVEKKKRKKNNLYAAEYFASQIFYTFTDERKFSRNALSEFGTFPTLVDEELAEKTKFPGWEEFSKSPLSRELAQKTARALAMNFTLQIRYFFRAHKGFQLSWLLNDKSGIRRPWKQQAFEVIAASLIAGVIASATKLTVEAAKLKHPEINVQNAIIASIACELIFGWGRKLQNQIFSSLGMTYDHASRRMSPYFPCAASTMFGFSMIVSLAPFLASGHPIDMWHMMGIGLLHLIAKYGPTMELAKAQAGSLTTGGGQKSGWWSTTWNTGWAGFSKTLKLLQNTEFSGVKDVHIGGQRIPVVVLLDAIYKGLAIHGGWRWLLSRMKGRLEKFPDNWPDTWAHLAKRWRKEKRSLHDKHVWLADTLNEWVRGVQGWFGADESTLYEPAAAPSSSGILGKLLHGVRYPTPNYCARLLIGGRRMTAEEMADPIANGIL